MVNSFQISRAAAGRAASIALLFLATVVVYFLPALLNGSLLGPTDGIAQNFPDRLVVAAAWRSGEIPFWNPYIFSGMPLMATIHPGVFFPGNWPFFVLPPYWANNVAVMFSFWYAGLGAYALARALMLPRMSSLFAGATFMLGGFFALHVAHIQMIQAAGLLPWLLWAIERRAGTGQGRYAIAGCFLLTLQILAGHPQVVAYSSLLVGAYGLVRLMGLPGRGRWHFGRDLVLLFCLGLGLALPQLLPTIDLIGMSQRKVITVERLGYYSLPLASLPGLLSPYLFGGIQTTGLVPHGLWADAQTFAGVFEGYAGVAAIVLAAVALLRWRQEPRVRFWALAALACLVLALGKNTPFFRLWAELPVVNMMPYASRHLMGFTLAMAILGAYGLASLEQAARRPARRFLAAAFVPGLAVIGLLLVVALFGPGFAARTQPLLPPERTTDMAAALSLANPALWIPFATWLGLVLAIAGLRGKWANGWRACLLLVAIGDLYLYGQHYQLLNPKAPTAIAYTPALNWQHGRALTLRVHGYPYPYTLLDYNVAAALDPPNLSMLKGVPTIGGYDAFILDRYGMLLGMGSEGNFDGSNRYLWDTESHVVDLLGLRTVRLEGGLSEQPFWKERLATSRWRPAPGEGELNSFENLRALPRAWRVEQATVLPASRVNERISHDPGFDPRREALFEEPLAPRDWRGGTVAATTPSFNRIDLVTEGDGPGLVLVSESYDPGWRAFSEGRELPVRRADALIMAVEVPPGRHEVALRYEPRLWRPGLAGAGLALVGVGLWGRASWRRARRRRPFI